MAHPIHHLARALKRRRNRHALEKVLADRHLARDIGQPHLPPERKKPVLW